MKTKKVLTLEDLEKLMMVDESDILPFHKDIESPGERKRLNPRQQEQKRKAKKVAKASKKANRKKK